MRTCGLSGSTVTCTHSCCNPWRAAVGRETTEIARCRDHHSRGRVDRDIVRRGAARLLSAPSSAFQARHASCHVGRTGDFRSAGVDPDHRSQQPDPRRFSGIDIAVRPSAGADRGVASPTLSGSEPRCAARLREAVRGDWPRGQLLHMLLRGGDDLRNHVADAGT